MADLNLKHAKLLQEQRSALVEFVRDAVALHGETIQREIDMFNVAKQTDPARWARLVCCKAILSSGVKLDPNIAVARRTHSAMENGFVPVTYEDVSQFTEGLSYGSQCAGQNIKKLLLSWNVIQNDLSPEEMTFAGLTVRQAKKEILFGQKTKSWALALWDAKQKVCTIDRWMARLFFTLIGCDGGSEPGISKAAYPIIASIFVGVAEELGVDPLVAQWSAWNEVRHPGQHASHIGLVA